LGKQGKAFMMKRVDKALGELRQLGHFGNDGGATVAWDTDDFMASMVDFGDPPANIKEAHTVRNSRRIEGAITKRERKSQGTK